MACTPTRLAYDRRSEAATVEDRGAMLVNRKIAKQKFQHNSHTLLDIYFIFYFLGQEIYNAYQQMCIISNTFLVRKKINSLTILSANINNF